MKTIFLLLSFLLVLHNKLQAQTTNGERFQAIKRMVQPDMIQLADSDITFPLTGLTYIRVLPPSQVSMQVTEIELWVIDATGKIIYNNIIATTTNCGQYPLDEAYCHYMKMQCTYLLHQRHNQGTIAAR